MVRIKSKITRTANNVELILDDERVTGYMDSKLSLFEFFRGDSSFDNPYIPSFKIVKGKDDDVLVSVMVGGRGCLLVSKKLHDIIMNSNYWSIHSYRTKVYYKETELDYFILLFPNKIDVIDFSKSEVTYHPPLDDGLPSRDDYTPVKFDNFIDYSKRPDGYYRCYDLHLLETDYDIFRSNVAGGGGIYISDRLKDILIENKCKGIEYF